MTKLAIISSHPIQYYAPWFRHINQINDIELKVYYLWDFGATNQFDPKFNTYIQWDLPLLRGYLSEFVPNISSNPGTHGFWGLQNPTLMRQVQQFRPDVVLLFGYNYASLWRFLLTWNDGALLFRGDSHRLAPQKGLIVALKRKIISRIFKKFRAFLYVGQANYNYFRYHGVNSQQLFFAPHAVDNYRFISQFDTAHSQAKTWKIELEIPDDSLVVLFAGKFEAQKRPLDLLAAFIQSKLKNTTLLFVGSGSLEEQLKSEAEGHTSVYFAPFQNQSQMPRTYAIADLVVLPSYSETWGLVINEAMCMGKPVIVSSRVGCAQDLVTPDENGLIFPAGDVAALAEALQTACANPSRLKQWGKASYRKITDYSYTHATEGLLQALQYVL